MIEQEAVFGRACFGVTFLAASLAFLWLLLWVVSVLKFADGLCFGFCFLFGLVFGVCLVVVVVVEAFFQYGCALPPIGCSIKTMVVVLKAKKPA